MSGAGEGRSLSPVDRMYNEFREILTSFGPVADLSLVNSLNDPFQKSLLLCAASYFERRIKDCVLDFVGEASHPTQLVKHFVLNAAASRGYHAWFDWDRDNANKFFALFGLDFKEAFDKAIQADSNLRGAIKSFMELGRDRNRLVHQDYGNFILEKTADEIHISYRNAEIFVQRLPHELRNLMSKQIQLFEEGA